MRPTLARIGLDGARVETVEAAPGRRRLARRHLAARGDGLIASAAQWEGDLREAPPLLALGRPGADRLDWRRAPDPVQRRTRGYAGSVAIAADGGRIALTAPRGGLAIVFDGPDAAFAGSIRRADICGVAAAGDALLFTDGGGGTLRLTGAGTKPVLAAAADVAWDNHLVAV